MDRPLHQSRAERYAAFRHRAYLRFWTARLLTTFATQVVSVAVGWQMYDLTRDPFDLGLVGIVQFLPSLILFLVTGIVADRFGRRIIMGLAGLLEAACAAVWLHGRAAEAAYRGAPRGMSAVAWPAILHENGHYVTSSRNIRAVGLRLVD